MTVEASGNDLVQAVALLAAGVVAVPIFKRLGLGSVLGYLDGRPGRSARSASASSPIRRPSCTWPNSAS